MVGRLSLKDQHGIICYFKLMYSSSDYIRMLKGCEVSRQYLQVVSDDTFLYLEYNKCR